MPAFATPEPITLAVDVIAGGTRVTAEERTDTVVEVGPADPGNRDDVKAAEGTAVDFTAGRLTVRTPRVRSPFGSRGSVEVVVHLPTGSHLVAHGSLADFRTEGALGGCRVKTSAGDVEVERVTGQAELSTGSGELRVGRVEGSATVKNSNGATRIDHVDGDVEVNSANGDISVGHAEGDLRAKSANGHIRVAEVVRGTVVVETQVGKLEIGVREGTAAWLDVRSAAGRVRNELTPADGPAEAEERVEVRARTSMGDIVIHRS